MHTSLVLSPSKPHIRTVFLIISALCLAFGNAHAQSAGGTWAVHDQDANNTLNNIKNDLDDIKQQHVIAGYTKLEDAAPEPAIALAAQDLNQDAAQCNNVAQNQQDICTALVQTENAQITYMTTMWTIANTRNGQLTDIETERSQLDRDDAHNYGALQNNTNKLLALSVQLSIDRAQMQTVMNGYQARIQYLKDEQARVTMGALAGQPSGNGDGSPLSGSVGSLVNAAITGAVLQGALELIKTPAPAGMKTLSIENSNGL